MSEVVRIERPFTGGLNTRVAREHLKPTESDDMENVIFIGDVAQERNGISRVGIPDPLGASSFLRGVRRVEVTLPVEQSAYIVSDSAGRVGVMTDAAATLAFTIASPQVPVPGAEYGGEVLLADDSDGQYPVIRYYAFTSAISGATGTFTIAVGAKRAVGVGTNFDPEVPEGSYIAGIFRVTERSSDTQLGLANECDVAVAAQAPDASHYGYIGLRTLVDDEGAATHGASATTITGNGTSWASGPNAVRVGDIVLKATGDDIANALVVTAVTSDIGLTVAANTVGAYTDTRVVILRRACGTIVCAHDNRLWFAGVPWAKDAVYLTPEGYDMGKQLNGAFSSLTDAGRAAQLFQQYVPSPTAGGDITALVSTQQGLLVGKSSALYIVRGQYPSLNVSKIADVGCWGQQSLIAVDDGVFLAGPQGIFQLRGSELIELSADRRPEYLDLVPTFPTPAIGLAYGHLVLSIPNDDLWVYDIAGRRWCGDITPDETPTVPFPACTAFHSSRLAGEAPKLLFVSHLSATRAVGDMAPAFLLDATGGTDVTTNRGRFRATLPPSALGPVGQLTRIKGVKVSYVLDAVSGSATVSASADDATFTDETPTLTDNSANANETPTPVRVYPTSGQLGVRGRSHRIRITRSASATTLTRFRVSAIEAIVQRSRARA